MHTSQPQFIEPLHLFRGIAIIAIVGAHAWSFMIFWTGQLDSTALETLFAVTESLFHGSTLYFALISGLLFSLVLSDRSYLNFYKNKLLNVVLPYSVISLFYYSLYGGWEGDSGGFTVFAMALLYGQANIHLWYIPVLLSLYVLTPLLWHLINNNKLVIVSVLIMLSPLVISRSPFPDFLKPQTFVYFIGAYTVGLFVGRYFQQVLAWFKRYQIAVFSGVVISSTLVCLSYFTDFPDFGWFSMRQSLIYVQKLLFAGLVIQWLDCVCDVKYQSRFKDINERKSNKLRNYVHRFLSRLGDMAFSVYFIHVYCMGWIIYTAQTWVIATRSAVEIGLLGLASLVGSILMSMLLTCIIQKITGKYSRKLIGA